MTRPIFAIACPAVAAATIALVGLHEAASAAEQWNFYMHQSAPNFATSRGAKLFTEEIEKATGGELKVRLHLAGTLQINASNITQAVGENVVQVGDDLFNSGNVPVAGIPRLPMLIQSYDDFAKADAVLKQGKSDAKGTFPTPRPGRWREVEKRVQADDPGSH